MSSYFIMPQRDPLPNTASFIAQAATDKALQQPGAKRIPNSVTYIVPAQQCMYLYTCISTHVFMCHTFKGHFCLSSWLRDSTKRVERKSSPPYPQRRPLVLNGMRRSTGGEKGKEPDTAPNNTVGLGVENQKERGERQGIRNP